MHRDSARLDPDARHDELGAEGAVLLAVYSAGLGLAFLLAAVAFTQAMGAFRWLRDHYVYIRVIGGASLVVLGLLLFFHRDWWLRVFLNRLLEDVGLGEYLAARGRACLRRGCLDLAEDSGDVDASVRGREGPEPARGLLELAPASDLVATAGLVPGDDDMDKPLEEVLLRGLGGAPSVLESLVRGEVLAGSGEVEARSRSPPPLVPTLTECYRETLVATILLAGVDLFIRGKLETSLPVITS